MKLVHACSFLPIAKLRRSVDLVLHMENATRGRHACRRPAAVDRFCTDRAKLGPMHELPRPTNCEAQTGTDSHRWSVRSRVLILFTDWLRAEYPYINVSVAILSRRLRPQYGCRPCRRALGSFGHSAGGGGTPKWRRIDCLGDAATMYRLLMLAENQAHALHLFFLCKSFLC